MDSESRRMAVAQLGILVCDILSNRCFSLELDQGEFNISNRIHKDIYLSLPTTETDLYENLASRRTHAVLKREDHYFIKIGNLEEEDI
ncbi:hypothetical protein PRIPAC_70926, partial [Pristionchus pacificus]|uniref:Uncharacterized protein n=1 Tax=Pristionchus pacificus TaxID=54126 RepID=A0A2A6C1C0_PRIPA